MIFSKYRIPILSVVIFDIIAIGAIMFQVYKTDGFMPPLNEILFSQPICYFWILWSALVFFCINGIQKEYNAMLIDASSRFSMKQEQQIKSIVKVDLLYSYSKKLLLLLAGLPLIYIGSLDKPIHEWSFQNIVYLLVPFVCDFILYCYVAIKRKRQLKNC